MQSLCSQSRYSRKGRRSVQISDVKDRLILLRRLVVSWPFGSFGDALFSSMSFRKLESLLGYRSQSLEQEHEGRL